MRRAQALHTKEKCQAEMQREHEKLGDSISNVVKLSIGPAREKPQRGHTAMPPPTPEHHKSPSPALEPPRVNGDDITIELESAVRKQLNTHNTMLAAIKEIRRLRARLAQYEDSTPQQQQGDIAP